MKTSYLAASAVRFAVTLCLSSNLSADAQQVAHEPDMASVASMQSGPIPPSMMDARCGSIGPQVSLPVKAVADSSKTATETADSAKVTQASWSNNLMQFKGKVTQQTMEFLTRFEQRVYVLPTPAFRPSTAPVSPMVLSR